MRIRELLRRKKIFVLIILVAGAIASSSVFRSEATAQTLANDVRSLAFTTNAIADAIASVNSSQQAQLNAQLRQQLTSNDAQIIQAALTQSISGLRNALQDGFSCLRQNSVRSTSSGSISTLGRKCKRKIKDVGIIEKEPDELSCGLAQKAIDVGKSEEAFQECRMNQLNILNNVVGCFESMNANVDAAASTIRQFIDQRTQFAQKTLDLLDGNIRAHQNVENLITRELDGPGGYREQVNDLKNISAALDNALTDFAPGADRINPQQVEMADGSTITIAGGLEDRVENFYGKTMDRIGNNIYRGIVGQIRACVIGVAPPTNRQQDGSKFASAFAFPCDKNIGVTNGVFECMEIKACSAVDPNSPNQSGHCERAKEIFGKTAANISSAEILFAQNSAGRFDLSTQEGRDAIFEASLAETGKLKDIISQSLATFASGQYGFGTAPGAQIDFSADINKAFNRCIGFARKNFNEGNKTKDETNNIIAQSKTEIQQLRTNLNGDLNRAIDIITERMTRFRTKFTNVFDNTLKQFAENCRRSTEPRQILACLQGLRDQLKSGLDGRVVNEAGDRAVITTMQVPTIDPNNPGQTTTTNIPCTGFEDCIQKLEVTRRVNGEQREALKETKIQKANEHNEVMESIISQIGSVFNQSVVGPSGIKSFMDTVAKSLKDNGIAGIIKLKDREKESLEKNEDSNEDPLARIFKVPSNVLDVMAQKVGLQMVDDDSICQVRTGSDCGGGGRAGKGSIQGKLSDAGKDLKKSQEIASAGKDKLKKCTPKARDYESIKISLKDCDNPLAVCKTGLPRALAEVSAIGKITLDQLDEEDDRRGRRRSSRDPDDETFSECRARLESGGLDKVDSAQVVLSLAQKRDPLTEMERQEIAFTCLDQLFERGAKLFKGAREQYRTRHDTLMAHLDEIIDKCDKFQRERIIEESNVSRTLASAESSADTALKTCIGKDGDAKFTFDNSEVGQDLAALKEKLARAGKNVNTPSNLLSLLESLKKAGKLTIPAGSPDPFAKEAEIEAAEAALEALKRERRAIDLSVAANKSAYETKGIEIERQNETIADLKKDRAAMNNIEFTYEGQKLKFSDLLLFSQAYENGIANSVPRGFEVLIRRFDASRTDPKAIERRERMSGALRAAMLEPATYHKVITDEPRINSYSGDPYSAISAFAPGADNTKALWSLIDQARETYAPGLSGVITQVISTARQGINCRRAAIAAEAVDKERGVDDALTSLDQIHNEGIKSSCEDIVDEVDKLARNAKTDIDAISDDEDKGENDDDIVRTRRGT